MDHLWQEDQKKNVYGHLNAIYDEGHKNSARSITFGRGIVKKKHQTQNEDAAKSLAETY